MQRSPLVDEWRAEWSVQNQRQSVLDALEARFDAVPPADVQRAVAEMADLGVLRQWHRHAVRANSLADFRVAAGL